MGRESGERGPDAGGDAGEAVVEDVQLDVAHDSDALLIVTLRFPNGGRSRIPLAGEALGRLVEGLGLADVRELVGRPFSQLAPALPVNAGT